MEPNDMLRADPLDILFEYRNKSYGAYPLRKFYTQRMYIALSVTICLVLTGSFFYLHHKKFVPVITLPPVADTFITAVDLGEKIKPVIPPSHVAAPKAPAATEWKTPVIVPDKEVIKPIAKTDELNQTAIALTASTGTADNGVAPNNGSANSGTATTAMDSTESTAKIFERAEFMPEFPGGVEALKRFLQRNLQMPENNLDPGAKIRVTARFVVDANGKVTDVEIIQPADEVFNKEVKRVISKMPDWKPGIQNHRHVAVYFQLPVNFVNEE